MTRQLELLAPARDLSCGIAAISHGADAVYIGPARFGARQAAGNSVADIAQLCRYAHQFGAKVYATVNTILYNGELPAAKQLIIDLRDAGVDAFLVQDMGLVDWARSESGITLHASTQCDMRTPEKVLFLRAAGFHRVVLARELSLGEITAIHKAAPNVELEAFVHGALCVSFSGQCYASQCCFGRSANRGECAQFCRLPFDLVNADGKTLVHQKHLLSLKDMCRINRLEDMADAGITSFKIEGRLKGEDYVKNVVAAYSQAIDRLIAKRPDDYSRASIGRVTCSFSPDLRKTFNRGYTDYLLDGRAKVQPDDIASIDTPKAIGEPVGRVLGTDGRSLTVAQGDGATTTFANGDGLCFFDDHGELHGFRVNRVEESRGNARRQVGREQSKSFILFPQSMPPELRRGTMLYRNHDAAFSKALAGETAERKIGLRMTFRLTGKGEASGDTIDHGGEGFCLRASVIVPTRPNAKDAADAGTTVEVARQFPHQAARQPQEANIRKQLGKLGNTAYTLDQLVIEDEAGSCFIPSSMLADMRREAVEKLQEQQRPAESTPSAVHEPADAAASAFEDVGDNSYLLNVANDEAKAFYERRGVSVARPAYELAPRHGDVIMQCRHCIKRMMGMCGKRSEQWREPMSLRLADGRTFKLQFRCDKCQMNVIG